MNRYNGALWVRLTMPSEAGQRPLCEDSECLRKPVTVIDHYSNRVIMRNIGERGWQ